MTASLIIIKNTCIKKPERASTWKLEQRLHKQEIQVCSKAKTSSHGYGQGHWGVRAVFKSEPVTQEMRNRSCWRRAPQILCHGPAMGRNPNGASLDTGKSHSP